MESTNLVQWLIDEKHMSMRSAKDVLSRSGRICRMLNISDFNNTTMEQLLACQQFQDSSMFIKSQLKRTVTLCLEYVSHTGEQ